VKELYTGGSPMNPDIARIVVSKMNKFEKQEKIEILTPREKEIMEQLAKGNLYKEVAHDLEISLNTLKAHCYNIYQKLHVNNKTEAINKVFGKN
jgi:DNA-binding NarL/FixJ family response regulator